MRIYSMTATFGKLEHETLTLKPGLNVIHAPNEWGKSTWCAFLLAMLYGLDTRSKATRTGLPDKERYAPWSGSPMSGRMELSWNGRDITIERATKGRVPMGAFRAYETHSGMEVPELNESNCGQLLLGVERSVFQRAGFIRQAELPVTQDDALRRRLNALVTTGDESGDASLLEKSLRELKNRCRYNRSGLLPQAQQQRADLQSTLAELAELQTRQETCAGRLEENAARQEELRNHTAALAYARAKAEEERVSQAAQGYRLAQQRLEDLERECAGLPAPEEVEEKQEQLGDLRREMEEFRAFQQNLPLPPELPRVPECFLGLTPEQAAEQAQADAWDARERPARWWLLSAGGIFFAGAGALLWLGWPIPGALCAAAGLAAVIAAGVLTLRQRKRETQLRRRYGTSSPASWKAMASDYALAMEEHHLGQERYLQGQEELADRLEAVKQQYRLVCGEESLEQCDEMLDACRRAQQELDNARTDAHRRGEEYEALKAMAHPVEPPAREDRCRETAEETARLLRQLQEEERQLRGKSGEYRGRMQALGSRQDLEKRLAQVQARIRELERYDAALTLAQQTLTEATGELQRRFAPRISRGAQGYLARLTLGRYDRLNLSSDFTLRSGSRQEEVLRDARWRSDGTADQLYLALRLSVAQELTPGAPLILDDALVRFDEERMKAAMGVLREMAQSRQVIVFTCQNRESAVRDK